MFVKKHGYVQDTSNDSKMINITFDFWQTLK